MLFGGEGVSQWFNDVWVFDIAAAHWRELRPVNTIVGRMTHVACTYNNNLIVYGGMDEEKKVLYEVCVLQFIDDPYYNNPRLTNSEGPVSTRNQIAQQTQVLATPLVVCETCNHSSSNCSFSQLTPEFATPRCTSTLACNCR